MKKLFLLFVLLAACSGFEMMKEEQRYVQFIEETNKTDDIAYNAALEWMAKNFVDSKEVIQIKDKEQHHINATALGTFYIDILNTMTNSYYYNLDLKIKNNKIKFEFTTNTTVESGYYPQSRFVEAIAQNYSRIKTGIIDYINNYSDSEF